MRIIRTQIVRKYCILVFSHGSNIEEVAPYVSNVSVVEIHIPQNFAILHGQNLDLNIFNISGQLVDRYASIPVNNPNETIRFNIYKKNFSAGMYEVQLNYGNSILGAIKIVVE